jgi:thymidylate kinase
VDPPLTVPKAAKEEKLSPETTAFRTRVGSLVLRAVDGVVSRPVVMTSLPPPAGKDVDLLCRREEREAIAETLASLGFLPRSGRYLRARTWTEQWVLFDGAAAYAVDLNPVERYGLDPAEVEAFFAEARPVHDFGNIRRPAPEHLLLLTARRFVREGWLPEKRRQRLMGAVAEDPSAWQRARARARRWGAARGLRLLEQAVARGGTPPRASRLSALVEQSTMRLDRHLAQSVVRRARSAVPRPTAIVAFSGLDGSGKSTQVGLLLATLAHLDVAVATYRRPLGQSALLRAIRRSGKQVLEAVSRGTDEQGEPSLPSEGTAPPPGRRWDPNPPTKRLRERSALATRAWAALVAATIASHYALAAARNARRGRVLVFDRYQLDAVAQLHFFYARGGRLGFANAIVRRLCPDPICAFLLDVPAERAAARKDLQYDVRELKQQATLLRQHAGELRVAVLDGERPVEELAELIARRVWKAFA